MWRRGFVCWFFFGVVTAEFKHNIYNIKMIGRNASTIDVSEIKFDIIADADFAFCKDGAKFRQYLMQIRRFSTSSGEIPLMRCASTHEEWKYGLTSVSIKTVPL